MRRSWSSAVAAALAVISGLLHVRGKHAAYLAA